jgi:hypothetical protein
MNKKKSDNEQNDPTNQPKNEESANSQINNASDTPPAKLQSSASESKQGRRERRLHLIFAAVIAIAAVVYTTAAIWQLRLFSRQVTVEQRAWVGINAIRIRTEFRPEEPIRFEVRSENTGRTPALNVVIKKIVSSDPPNQETIDIPIDELEPTKIVISPGNKFSGLTKPVRLTETEIEAIKENRARIYIFGTIYYEDIFDRGHKTTYCAFYTSEYHPHVEFCPWFNHMD